MFLKQKILLVIFSFWMSCGFSQIKVNAINEIDSLLRIQPKPILVLLSTDWCSYCKVQKQLVQRNEKFKAKGSTFYYVEFDAESTDDIIFNGKMFKTSSKKNRKQTHELTFYLLENSKPIYPTWLLLDSEYNVLFKHQGFLKPKFLDELVEKIY